MDQATNTQAPAQPARKLDTDKLQFHLVPPEALAGAARAFAFGERKYSAWNWAGGFTWSRLYGAAQRHAIAWFGGEDNDPESGLCHLDHLLASVMMLAAHRELGIGLDDRPTYATRARDLAAKRAAQLTALREGAALGQVRHTGSLCRGPETAADPSTQRDSI